MKFKLNADSLVDLAAEILGDSELVDKAERFGEAALGALIHAGLPVAEVTRLALSARHPDGEIDPVALLNAVKGSAELEAWAHKWRDRFRRTRAERPTGIVREMMRDAIKHRLAGRL